MYINCDLVFLPKNEHRKITVCLSLLLFRDTIHVGQKLKLFSFDIGQVLTLATLRAGQ